MKKIFAVLIFLLLTQFIFISSVNAEISNISSSDYEDSGVSPDVLSVINNYILNNIDASLYIQTPFTLDVNEINFALYKKTASVSSIQEFSSYGFTRINLQDFERVISFRFNKNTGALLERSVSETNSVNSFYPRYNYDFTLNHTPSFTPSDDVYPLNIDQLDFFNWLTADGHRDRLLPIYAYNDYIRVTQDWELKYMIAYLNNYGGNYSAYINNYDKLTDLYGRWMDFNVVIDIMQKEYTVWNDAYQRYLSEKRLNNLPVPSTTINNNTYNNNITDTPDDSVDISILREITRLIGVSVNNQVAINDNTWNMLNVINNNIIGLVNVMNDISAKLNILTDISTKLDGLLVPVVSLGDTLNDIALDIVTIRDNSLGTGSGCNYDESFWELMLIPTFNDFDEIQSDFIDKFPIMNEIATISYIDGNTVIENQLPDNQLDGILADGLVPLAYANSDINIPLPDESQNEYGFQYSESDITSKDLFTFTMPTGTNDWTSSFNGMTIPLINFKRFGNAIKYFKGIVSVLALFNFTKWLLQFVPKIATGASTSD